MPDFYKNWAMKSLGLDKSFIPIHINVWYEYCKNAARNGSATVPSSEVREEEIFKDTRGTVISIQLNRKAYFRLYTATVTTKTDSTSLPPDQQVKPERKKKVAAKSKRETPVEARDIIKNVGSSSGISQRVLVPSTHIDFHYAIYLNEGAA